MLKNSHEIVAFDDIDIASTDGHIHHCHKGAWQTRRVLVAAIASSIAFVVAVVTAAAASELAVTVTMTVELDADA